MTTRTNTKKKNIKVGNKKHFISMFSVVPKKKSKKCFGFGFNVLFFILQIQLFSLFVFGFVSAK